MKIHQFIHENRRKYIPRKEEDTVRLGRAGGIQDDLQGDFIHFVVVAFDFMEAKFPVKSDGVCLFRAGLQADCLIALFPCKSKQLHQVIAFRIFF